MDLMLNFKNKKKRSLILVSLASMALFVVTAGAIFSMALFSVYSAILPSPSKLTTRNIEQSTKIFDRNGKLLYEVFADKNRTLVQLQDVSPSLIHATLSAEDSDFYKHRGFDLIGITRAGFNMLRGKGLQSGSTLTQQLVKNALLTNERTINRKIKEILLSLQIERKYSKDDILKMYLNEAPYGGTAYGVEAASQYYFSKSSKDLTLAESALIAGLPQSPSYYSPFGANPENATARQHYVLWLMKTRGWVEKDGVRHFITEEEYAAAREEVLKYASINHGIKAPHFVMYVKSLLSRRYNENIVENSGLSVTTSLDLDFQEQAEEIVKSEVDKVKYLSVGNAALVAIDPKTGQILAMVGSKDYFDMENDGNVNVTLSLRQPGSAIKPLTYITAFERGFTPSTVLFDVPTKFSGGEGQPPYIPVNYNGKYIGPTQIRYALANSINIPAVRMLKLIGVENVMDTAKKFGITTFSDPSRYGLSLTLGGGEVRLLELTNAFGVFASGGIYHSPVGILKVADAKGNVLDEETSYKGEKVIDSSYTYLISDILSDNNARAAVFGLGSNLVIPGHTVAAKTGTTNDIRDNWTIGYTPSIVIGVWAGNNDNSPMAKGLASGITGAAPIWQKAMIAYLKDKKDEKFEKPDNIIDVEVGKTSGMLVYEGAEDGRWEKFVKGTEPVSVSDWFIPLEVCKKDNGDYKLKKDCDDEEDKIKERIFVKMKAELTEWQEDVDAWIEENIDDKDYFPPD
ncbi:penicillin-binding protein [candidate division WWE3 bacterium CG23_combo_of_CG06-09_8_20_14_all_40_14]|uniref:Penicillin-binding protein n=1 Tax=candidate division WWE3 bacterium CG23_combo_of_CG06-09_8_20_14_all_40_14 TaxID=1975095 RepID=A0A2G9XCJ4_UNCKA|nr:MAG: penicillin-binding protein [candidate division WWE3 bacterium CG23_combo_of_CG06-09_8_20_14_all_40_14]